MFLQLAQHLNRATGDDAIDILKRRVVEQGAPLLLPTLSMLPHCKEAKIKAAWQAARGTKVADDEVNHAPTQHDANGMLQHK
ncbi:hypothetical protein SCLCIDRAFT_27892 [Scleroderma citrinum Foug A]|uniref:Uncharacterized protein n=1 Tax=Scleroderma citrinum Foug A TaxID=1036808 RepID=A0A0C3DR11_9AGAM|nr:hypothetical protein SCLCIDRAFT_27892 [Scleroderma citrinum Foug A]